MTQAVVIDADFKELVPVYLANRRAELRFISGFIFALDFESLRKTGHQLAGSGGSYGFERVSALGRDMESAAVEKDLAVLKKLAAELEEYLADIEPVYE